MEYKLKDNARKLRVNQTSVEKLLWIRIRNKQLGHRFNRQFIFDDKYILDFYCVDKKLVIELDGGQHCDCEKDKIRDNYLLSRGCRVLRFWNNEIMDNIEGCLFVINNNLDE